MNNVLEDSLFVSQNEKFDEIQSIVRQFSAEYVGNSVIKDNIFAVIQNYARKKEIALEMLRYPIHDDELWALTFLKQDTIFVCVNTALPLCKQFFAAAHELYHIYCYVENALAVIAASILLEIPKEYMHSGLLRARSSGRMELYGSADKNLIAVVDYAHNKLSFEKLFSSIKDEYPDYNIVSIFGCPGKKAFIRRRDLGTVAVQYAKKVYLTAEDPGYEPVEQISKEIAQYVEAQNCPYAMIEDRGEAIKAAMDEAEGKTIFLITGKGNETRQKYGCEYLDCKSDTQYVKEYLAEYDKKHQ